MIVASASAANPASTSAATSNGVATGQKRKTPPTDISNTHNPNANNSNNNTTTFTTNNNSTNTPTMISASPHFEISANLEVPNPGPQPWPNAIGPRPSLSGGLASGSVLMGSSSPHETSALLVLIMNIYRYTCVCSTCHGRFGLDRRSERGTWIEERSFGHSREENYQRCHREHRSKYSGRS
jgi:hypothetical protein